MEELVNIVLVVVCLGGLGLVCKLLPFVLSFVQQTPGGFVGLMIVTGLGGVVGVLPYVSVPCYMVVSVGFWWVRNVLYNHGQV